MSLFKKPDEHAGSGIDKPAPKSIVEKVVDKVKAATAPSTVEQPVSPATDPAIP